MNKLSIFLFGAMALGLAACDEAPATAPVQSNPQPPMYEDSQIACAKAGAFESNAVIELDSYQTAENGVPVASFETKDGFPAGAYPSGVLQISKSEDFATYKEVDVTDVDGTGYVSAVDLSKIIVDLFGRAQKERDIYYRMIGYVNQDGGIYRIGDPDTYVISGQATVVCMDSGVAISEAYYFLSGCTGWSLERSKSADFKMYHSAVDPMDDPVFRFYINISDAQGECWWKIAPAEAMIEDGAEEDWSGVYGPEENGNTNATGLVIEGGEAGKIPGAGTYCIEFDAISMEYNIYKTADVPYLFTPGTANGWNMYSSQWLSWNDGKKSYLGPVSIEVGDGVKFVDIVGVGNGGPNWGNPNYGGADGVLSLGGDNIKPAATGLYWAVVNTADLTYSLTEITSIGLIGVGGNWDNDIELVPTADKKQWTVTTALSGSWKIRMNHSWDINYGNRPDDLVLDGANIEGYDGTYTVTFDVSGNLPVLTISE